MKIEKCVQSISSLTVLILISCPYVFVLRGLTVDEIKAALIKTSPQYYFEDNVSKAVRGFLLNVSRKNRIIAPYILKGILLQKHGHISPKRETDEEVIKWEQTIIDQSNEDLLTRAQERTKDLELMEFVIGVAWENDDDLSVDEKNLVEKIRARLMVTPTELRIMEAKIGKFPKPSNELHTRQEIEEVRRELQASGLIFAIRDNDGTDFDVIPEEIASVLCKVLGVEIRGYGYREMLKYKAVKSKGYIADCLKKVGIKVEKNPTVDTLAAIAVEQLSPRVLLGGTSPKDGLSMGDLSKWCSDLELNVSGTKNDRIDRIINFYNSLHERDDTVADERVILYKYFEQLASRDRDFLRSQKLIEKDIEIERKFEEVTNYIFEKKLGHKPLKLVGTNHADGILSYKDKIILWDNKSKESPVNLKDHIKQFDGYIKQSEKPLAGFMVIAPSFTQDSSLLAMQYQVENGTMITMITAKELQDIADAWDSKDEGSAFPLGYLIQSGRFNPALVAAL